MNISVRPMTSRDDAFDYRVFSEVKAQEFAPANLPPEQLDMLIRSQYVAQKAGYTNDFPNAEWLVIEADGAPAGRLIVNRSEHELLGVDIAILPDAQSRGIGSTVIRDLLAEAEGRGVPMRIHVEKMNRARQLYQRLGFHLIGAKDFHFEMLNRRDSGAGEPVAGPDAAEQTAQAS